MVESLIFAILSFTITWQFNSSAVAQVAFVFE